MTPALGISVSYSTGDGSGSVGSTASFDLDDSTSLHEEAVLAGGELSQTRTASGTGKNTIASSVGGNGYSVSNTVDSSGSMGVSAEVAATSDAAGISQSTSLSGESGGVSFVASSKNNVMAVAGGFSGESSMNSNLEAVAGDGAAMRGSASIAGVQVLDDSNLGIVASGEIGMSVDGLYIQPSSGKLGEFSLSTANVKNVPGSSTQAATYGSTYSGTDRASAYTLTGWKWTQANPNIKLYLKSNTIPYGLSAGSVAGAVNGAENTWDAASSRTLFSGVTIDPSANVDAYDGKNVIAWKNPFDMAGALAYTRTWVWPGGSVAESDVSLNPNWRWSTGLPDGRPYYSGDSIDIQSVVTHELGHTLGLGDLYGKSQFAGDTRQMMHYYTGVKHTLGSGDKTGIKAIYG